MGGAGKVVLRTFLRIWRVSLGYRCHVPRGRPVAIRPLPPATGKCETGRLHYSDYGTPVFLPRGYQSGKDKEHNTE